MLEELTLQKQDELYSDPEYKEMIDAGVFYGRKKSKTHPRMKPYVLGNRNGIEIINLLKSRELLDKALNFLKGKYASGASFLLVATQPPAEDMSALASEFNLPLVQVRWLGGTLTNFKVIQSRIDYFRKLKSDWEKNAFEKYTKKERLGIERELRRLQELFLGLEGFSGLPDAVLVIDSDVHKAAVREARHKGIPVVALLNTDNDPEEADYPVVGNTRAKTSIAWFASKVRQAFNEVKTARAARTAATAAAAGEVPSGGA